MKKLLSFAVIIVLLFSFVGCNTNPQPPAPPAISTPQNVSVNDSGLIYWDAVEGAIGYIVKVNSLEKSVSNATSLQVDAKQVEKGFTYSVAAVDANYNFSAFSAEQTFAGTGTPANSNVTVNISGVKDMKGGSTLQLTATVENADDTSVTWSVVQGTDVISVDANGLVTAKQVSADTKVSVRATSVANTEKSQTREFTVITKPMLTQAMLDNLQGDRVSFNGYVNIDAYTIGTFSEFYNSYSMLINTMADGHGWYAEYVNSIGSTSSVYCAEHNGKACTVSIDYLNEESFEPIVNDDGSELSWQESGYYNGFNGLKVGDFSFNEETWTWDYSGADKQLPSRMIAAANPYDFKEKGFSLSIYNGEIVGITAVSMDDYAVLAGYRCIQTLYSSVTVYDADDEEFKMPTVSKYSHQDVHDKLQVAIDNMHNLKAYKVDFCVTDHSVYTGTSTQTGYVETVTENLCYFVPYDISYKQDYTEVHTPDNAGSYGYYKASETLYNSFYNDGKGNFFANRAFNDSFDSAKPSFRFASEIFVGHSDKQEVVDSYVKQYLSYHYPQGVGQGAEMYMVDGMMAAVATTMYKSVGNDMALYGIFASDTLSLWEREVDATFVVVQNDYITDVVFWYDMYIMYGIAAIHFSDFDTATLPEEVSFDTYTVRQVPVSWAEISVETDDPTPVSEFLAASLGEETVLPFFGEVLGDSYGFAMNDVVHISSDSVAHPSLLFYYDVPLDDDYSITSSLQALSEFLVGLGFTKNAYDEYNLGNLWIAPIDNDLDLIIYVWATAPTNK